MPSDLDVIGPGSDPAQIANTINQNMQKIAAEDTIKIWKDNNGVPQVLLGREGQGENPKFKVAQNGIDVTQATDDQLIMSSDFNMFKIFMSGEEELITSGASPRVATFDITHNLGYSPVIVGSVQLSTGLSSEVMGFPGAYYQHSGGTGFLVRAVFEYFASDNNTATVQVREDIGGGTWKVRYYVLVETGAD